MRGIYLTAVLIVGLILGVTDVAVGQEPSAYAGGGGDGYGRVALVPVVKGLGDGVREGLLRVWPQPVKAGGRVLVDGLTDGVLRASAAYEAELVTLKGEVVPVVSAFARGGLKAGRLEIWLPEQLMAGVYVLRLKGRSDCLVAKMVVR